MNHLDFISSAGAGRELVGLNLGSRTGLFLDRPAPADARRTALRSSPRVIARSTRDERPGRTEFASDGGWGRRPASRAH
jgi:hypothetical protein